MFLEDIILLNAINTRRAVAITYEDRYGEVTHRTIEPYDTGISRTGNRYLRAMDRMRGEVRTFRFTRVLSCTELDEEFVLPNPWTGFAGDAAVVAELNAIDAALARIKAEIAQVAEYRHCGDAARWTPEPCT